jgi:hypothetical protein
VRPPDTLATQTVALTVAPPPPVPFARREPELAKNPGRPLAPEELNRIRPAVQEPLKSLHSKLQPLGSNRPAAAPAVKETGMLKVVGPSPDPSHERNRPATTISNQVSRTASTKASGTGNSVSSRPGAQPTTSPGAKVQAANPRSTQSTKSKKDAPAPNRPATGGNPAPSQQRPIGPSQPLRPGNTPNVTSKPSAPALSGPKKVTKS